MRERESRERERERPLLEDTDCFDVSQSPAGNLICRGEKNNQMTD